MLTPYIQQLMQRQSLSESESQQAIEALLQADNTAQIAAFLVLLHAKGETADELKGIVKTMQAHMEVLPIEQDVLDIVGTGGDGANTVNISTAASIVAASVGARVVKHGNRSVSSKCGSADVLQQLGVNIDMSSKEVADSVAQHGFGFCFAPHYHPAMKKLKSVRQQLAVRTTFNLLGPLLNPAKAKHIVLGVYSEKYLDLFADVLQQLGVKHALVVHGCGLDELNTLGPASVVEVTADKKQSYQLDPKEFGFDYCELDELAGGEAQLNAQLITDAFAGQRGPIADTIALNAGAGLYVAGVANTIAEGVALAKQSLLQGLAMVFLQKLTSQSEVRHA